MPDSSLPSTLLQMIVLSAKSGNNPEVILLGSETRNLLLQEMKFATMNYDLKEVNEFRGYPISSHIENISLPAWFIGIK